MKWNIVLLLVMFACPAVQADVFEWIDGQGVVHFTDNLDKVPGTFRNKVRKKTLAEDAGAGNSAEKVPPPVVAAPSPKAQVQLYGGYDEQWWRSVFKAAQGEIKTAQDQLAVKNQSLAELHRKRVIFQKPSDREAYFALANEISDDGLKIKRLLLQLTALQAQADTLGVPQEWRQ